MTRVFGSIGFQELLIILLIVLVLFGARRLPEFGKALGKGIREFKKAATEIQAEGEPEEDPQPKEKEPGEGGELKG